MSSGQSREPYRDPAAEDHTLRRYEMWVRTVISPVLVAALPVRAARAAMPRRSLHRLRIAGDGDVPAVLQRLAECGVEVLDIRGCDGPT